MAEADRAGSTVVASFKIIVAGLDSLTSGRAFIGDADLSTLNDHQLTILRRDHVGFVFQMYNLLPVLTAAKNVELPLLLTKLSSGDRKRRVQIALNVVGLGERANHYPRQLSGAPMIQLEESDVISFHSYDKPSIFERKAVALSRYHRPLICTEYMARSEGSTFEGTLPIARKYHIGAINWGLVQGKTQTIYPWDSWQKPYDHEPVPWFHDIFRADGSPYDPAETALIRKMSGTKRAVQ